jgi:hypothetical protein
LIGRYFLFLVADFRLQPTETQSSLKKKWIIGGIVCLVSLAVLGTAAGATASSLLNKCNYQKFVQRYCRK